MAVLLYWSTMIFVPTAKKRNVVIAVQIDQDHHRITRIAALICDHERITQALFDDSDESRLLLGFWSAINAGDRIFSAEVVKVFETVRLRSWHLGLLPSLDLDLRHVYGLDLHDTADMGARA